MSSAERFIRLFSAKDRCGTGHQFGQFRLTQHGLSHVERSYPPGGISGATGSGIGQRYSHFPPADLFEEILELQEDLDEFRTASSDDEISERDRLQTKLMDKREHLEQRQQAMEADLSLSSPSGTILRCKMTTIRPYEQRRMRH